MKVWISLLSVIFAIELQGKGLQISQEVEPECLAYGRNIEVNNAQILHYKRTTQNQFQERGRVQGPISAFYSDKNGHAHFQIRLGNRQGDTLEVIYNQDFGELPNDLELGAEVEACGDYITATAQSGPYPPSPDGAIIHWVHLNPRYKGHPSGFLMINGVLRGTDVDNAGPKPYPNLRQRRRNN